MSVNAENQEELIGLLPFYLSGQIEPQDKALVESWLESSGQAREILAKIEEERGSVITANEQISAPAQGLARLMADVKETKQELSVSAKTSSVLTQILNALWRPFDVAPKQLAWGLCGLLMLVTISQSVLLYSNQDGGFELASGEKLVLQSRAIVMFGEQAKMEDISVLLDELGVVIINGPTAAGQYIIGFVERDELPPLAKRIEILKAKKDLVVFYAATGK